MLQGMVETSSINNLTCVFVCRAIHLQCTEAVQHCSDRVTWRSYFWRLTASLIHSLSLSPYVKFGAHNGTNPIDLSSEKSLVVFTCWDWLQLQDCVARASLLNVCIKGLVVETVIWHLVAGTCPMNSELKWRDKHNLSLVPWIRVTWAKFGFSQLVFCTKMDSSHKGNCPLACAHLYINI